MKTGTSKLMDSHLVDFTTIASADTLTSNTSSETLIFNKTFVSTPDYVGCYALGGNIGLKIYFGKKPKWLHRKMMKLCLGWEWIDN